MDAWLGSIGMNRFLTNQVSVLRGWFPENFGSTCGGSLIVVAFGRMLVAHDVRPASKAHHDENHACPNYEI